jgi:flagellar hook-associated protein 2
MAVKGISLGSSGLDIDTLVKNSIATYQAKYDKKYKAKVTAEWTKTAYSDIYSPMKDFRTGTISDYKLSSSTTARTATSTLTAVSATANGDAATMTHDVTVSQLATGAFLQTAQGAKVSKDLGGGKTSVKLSDIAGIDISTGADDATALSFKVSDGINTKTISYTYKQLRDQTKIDTDGEVIVTEAAKTLNDLASDINTTIVERNADGTIKRNADGTTVDIKTNVKAKYDSVNDSFSLSNSKSGSDNKIQITLEQDGSGNNTAAGSNAKKLFDAFGLSSYDSSNQTTTALGATALYDGTIAGKNSKFVVDGKSYEKDSNSNTINGVTYTLNDATETGKFAKVSIGTDTTALIDKVQKFVDSYNAMLDKLNTKIYEKKDSNYGPLTDDEKKEMSDTQLTTWETKAKTGLLSKDTILSNIVSNMRSAVSDKVTSVSGKYNTLSAIGITTSDYTEHGKLHLNTEKLTKAIADDPNCVNELFTSTGADNQSSGVAYRLSTVFDDGMKSITNKAGTSSVTNDQSALGTNIATMTDDLKTLQALLNAKETYYYNKYNAMEAAMSKGTSTINTLSSYLGKSS